jgi:hypothetical protein
MKKHPITWFFLQNKEDPKSICCYGDSSVCTKHEAVQCMKARFPNCKILSNEEAQKYL